MTRLWQRYPRLTLATVAIIMLLLLIGWRLMPGDAPKKDSAPVPVATATATRTDVPVFLTGLGTVNSPHEVVVRPRIDGQLMSLHFHEGQQVQKGDLLATLDDRTIRAQLARVRAELARLQVQLKTANQDLQRFRELAKEDAITAQAVEQQEARLAETRAAIDAARASVAEAETALAYTRITSPARGRTGLRRVDAGNIVRASDVDGIVTVTQTDPLDVIFTLPQASVGLLPALAGKANVEIIDGNKTVVANGKLTTIDNRIDTASGTIRLRASFTNDENRLWPGQFVTVRLHAGLQHDALVVPVKAVQRGREDTFVYRVRDNKAERATVTIAFENDTLAVIGTGLSAGDTVVTDGQLRLRPGTRVSTGDKPNAPR